MSGGARKHHPAAWFPTGLGSRYPLLLHRHRGPAPRSFPLSVRRCRRGYRLEEHTSELQSLMRNSYAVCFFPIKTYTYTPYRHLFCLHSLLEYFYILFSTLLFVYLSIFHFL